MSEPARLAAVAAGPLSDARPAPIEFWFDFISPFGYFASLRIDELAARHGRQVEWHALLVGVTVLKVMGMKPLPQTPLKGAYLARQIARYRRRHGVALARPAGGAPMNPLPAARLFAWLCVHRPENAKAFARAVFAGYWAQGRELDQPEALRDAMQVAALPAALAEEVLDAPEAAALLREEVDAAIARGAFGSPYFIVDGEPFFGVDNLELLDEWLGRGGW